MASARVISLELVIYLSRSAESLFKTISSHKRCRSVHLIEVQNLLRYINIRVIIIKLLLNELIAENRS